MNDLALINRLITTYKGVLSRGENGYMINVKGVTITFYKDKLTFDNTEILSDEFIFTCRYPKSENEFKNFIKEITYVGSKQYIDDYDNDKEQPTYIGKMYL